MELRQLGRSGLSVSTIGLGCNNLGGRTDATGSLEVVRAAVAAGITLFDTADYYSEGESERLLGEALGADRQRVVVATKFGLPMQDLPGWPARGSRAYLHLAVRNSLRRLGTDWIDLYQLHVPDPLTPIDETLEALDELVHQGLIRYAGCSQFLGWQLAEAHGAARALGTTRFISAQNQLSLLDRETEAEVLPLAERYGMGLLPFFPLSNGLLTGKYRRNADAPEGSRLAKEPERGDKLLTDEAFDRVEALTEVAAADGATLLELALGGLLANPTVSSVIAGATSPAQIEANVAAGAYRPSAEARAALDAASPPPARRA